MNRDDPSNTKEHDDQEDHRAGQEDHRAGQEDHRAGENISTQDDNTYSADDQRRTEAASKIQRWWRQQKKVPDNQKDNHLPSEFLNTDLRWNDAAVHARMKLERSAADSGKNSPREHWRRAIFYARRLKDGNPMLDGHGITDEAAGTKHLETQHWLEMVDGKHRYGSNRLTMAKEKISHLKSVLGRSWKKRYLSAEQRLNYLVNIDSEGKLRWARNDELVDTAAGRWKDKGMGDGVIPEDHEPTKLTKRQTSFESVVEEAVATHYAGEPKGKHSWTRYLRKYLTTPGITERLLRKTVRKNTWMYVSDKHFNVFVGIKDTGSFQHSSLVAGGLVTSAGLISVKAGMVHTLSPLSGHYRTSVDHFHRFLDAMEKRGMNMSKVQISKAEAALWGIEHINKWKKAQSSVVSKGKSKMKDGLHAVASVGQSKSSDSNTKGEEQNAERPVKPQPPASKTNEIEQKTAYAVHSQTDDGVQRETRRSLQDRSNLGEEVAHG